MPPFADPQVIIASPDVRFRERIGGALSAMRWPSVEALGGADALNKLDSLAGIETVVFDRSLPDLDVDDLDVSLRARRSNLDVLLVDLAAEESCYSNRTLIHPRSKELTWQLGRSAHVIQSSSVPHRVMAVVEMPLAPVAPLPGLIGNHRAMAELSAMVRLVAPRKTSVLITGETGTGKEVVARAVHHLSPRANGPFVALNCAAIPEGLLESELFGYARGAFTGAMQPRVGRIEAAHGGTLFLDEIGELPASLQAKLLRFLQEKEVQRLGSNETTRVDVRIVAATHINLLQPGEHKIFRQDLYYRLAVFPVALPPLRERQDDILLLARHFLSDICAKDGVTTKELDAEASALLRRYEWPGNVRELQHVMERAFILSQDERVLTLKHLPCVDPKNVLNLA